MQQANEFAEENEMKFIETFAESNINVIEAFITLCMELIIFAKDSQFCQVKEVKNIVLNDNNIDLNKKKHNIKYCN